jgi:hypothetical protein
MFSWTPTAVSMRPSSQLGQYPEAITELRNGRFLRGDDHAKVAADEIALRKVFAAQGAKGFWQEIQKWNERDFPNVGEFDIPQVYSRLGEKKRPWSHVKETLRTGLPW